VSQIENVTVNKEANIYFDGQCVSYTLTLEDGTRKSVGTIFPGSLTFNTAAPEIMELVKGRCKVRMAGEEQWNTYSAGEQFSVAGNCAFDIEIIETLNYVCHYQG